jgi:hypothetical protein
MRKETKEHHAKMRPRNTDIIAESGEHHEVRNDGDVFIFRDTGSVVQFYPAKGSWYDQKSGKYHTGGAAAFLKWYRKRKIT